MLDGDANLEGWHTQVWLIVYDEAGSIYNITKKLTQQSPIRDIVSIQIISNGWVSDNTLRNL